MSNLTQATIKAIFAAMSSAAQQLGVIERTATHEPENTPGKGISCSITLGQVTATPQASGLASVSGTVDFQCRLWSPLRQRPLDSIDPDLLYATVLLCGQYASGFTLSGLVRDIDVLAVRASAVYIPDDEGKPMRVIDITVPVVINDIWTEAP